MTVAAPRSQRRRAAAAILVVGAIAVVAAGGVAQATPPPGTTLLGRTAVPNPSTSCVPTTFVQDASLGDAYRVATAGVVTSFRFQAGATAPTLISFKIGRPAGAAYTVVASTPQLAPVSGELLEQPVRVPVAAGDHLGIYVSGGSCAYVDHPASGSARVVHVDAPVGTTVSTTEVGYEVAVAAVLEPDADGDGYGDVSQDLCPTSAATHGVCTPPPPPPVAPALVAPDTSLGGATVGKVKHGKARVTVPFASSGAARFECAVDSPTFAPCTSPFTTKLRVGKHVVAVRAVGETGLVDPTAALTSAKVKAAPRRR